MIEKEIQKRANSSNTSILSDSLKQENISFKIPINNEFECVSCNHLWLWGYPSILTLGLVGNALCIVAFVENKLRWQTRLLCALLTVFDSLALILTFATRWPDVSFGISPVNLHRILCQVFTIANYWLPELSAWTLVEISIERLLSGILNEYTLLLN